MCRLGEQVETAPLEKTFSFHSLMALRTCGSKPEGQNLAVVTVNTDAVEKLHRHMRN